jgi:hypothetical protein
MRRLGSVSRCAVLWGLLVTAPTAAIAQVFPACPQPAIRTRDALVAALRDLRHASERGNSPDIESAFIATLGQPVVGWAYGLAVDSAGDTDLELRASAFQVLRYARYHAAVPALTRLGTPFVGPWVVWQGSLHALSTSPFPELAPFWRDLLHFPRRVVRETALRGLSLTGSAEDIPDIRDAFHREDDAWSRHIVAQAESLLVLPVAVRDTIWFVWPPDPAGRFVPSGSWLRMGMRLARAAGRCPP